MHGTTRQFARLSAVLVFLLLLCGAGTSAFAVTGSVSTLTPQVGDTVTFTFVVSSGETSQVDRITVEGMSGTTILSFPSGTTANVNHVAGTYTISATCTTAGTQGFRVLQWIQFGVSFQYWNPQPYWTLTASAPPPPPGAPGSFGPTGTDYNTIALAWTAGSNATTYRLERQTQTGWYLVSLSSALSATDDGLTPSTTYNYRLRSENSSGNSSYVTTSATTGAPPPPPSAPTGLTASSSASPALHASLSWSSVAGVDGYYVERATGNGSFGQIGTASTNSYTDNGVGGNTTYRYRVSAFDEWGTSGYSNIASTTTPTGPPQLPTVNWSAGLSSMTSRVGSTTSTLIRYVLPLLGLILLVYINNRLVKRAANDRKAAKAAKMTASIRARRDAKGALKRGSFGTATKSGGFKARRGRF